MAAIISRGVSNIPNEEVFVVDFNGAATATLPLRAQYKVTNFSAISNGADAFTLSVNETFGTDGAISMATPGQLQLVASAASTSKFLVNLTGY